MESLIQSGSAVLCGVMNQDFSCTLMLQRGVFEDLVRSGVMMWGDFSTVGTGEELHCEKSINPCRIILKTGLPPKSCFLKQNNQIFQQDNAPAHTAVRQSLDLNPIQNIWSHIKH